MDGGTRSAGALAHRRSGDGPPVVLVHGIPGAARAWDAVAERLPEGLDVIVPDLLGFGDSRAPRPATIDELGAQAQARALAALLDELAVSRAVLVGHDFGGPVCALLARSRPDLASGVVLLAANAFPDTPIPFPLSLVTVPVLGPLASRMLFSGPSLRLMLRQGVGRGSAPPDPAVYVGGASQAASIATIFSGALTRLAELYAPVEAALRDLDVPVVVGWGEHDRFFGVAQGRRTADAAGGRLHLFPGAGHFLPHERPAQVAEVIEELVSAVNR